MWSSPVLGASKYLPSMALTDPEQSHRPPEKQKVRGRWGAPTEKLQPSAREEWDRKTACPSKGITEEKRVLATAGLSQRAHVCPEL